MDPHEVIELFAQLHEECVGYQPVLTVHDSEAARKLATIGDGAINALAVVARWDKFALTLIDGMHCTFPPTEPSLAFIVQHLRLAEDIVRTNSIPLPPQRTRPTETVDQDGHTIIDGPSPTAVLVE